MRKIKPEMFEEQYKTVMGTNDYIESVRKLDVGESIAIPSLDQNDASKIRHHVIVDSANMRSKGKERRYKTVIMKEPVEVWIMRVE